jgi:aspartate-semialdehyde dehydrogenase
VGEVVLRLLAERRFPVGELRAREQSLGRQPGALRGARGGGAQGARAFEGIDFASSPRRAALPKELAAQVAKRGGVVIDKSSTWRLDANVRS